MRAPPETIELYPEWLTENQRDLIDRYRKLELHYGDDCELSSYLFVGSTRNRFLISNAVAAVYHYQQEEPEQPIHIWVTAVPHDSKARDLRLRNVLNQIRGTFREAETTN